MSDVERNETLSMIGNLAPCLKRIAYMETDDTWKTVRDVCRVFKLEVMLDRGPDEKDFVLIVRGDGWKWQEDLVSI